MCCETMCHTVCKRERGGCAVRQCVTPVCKRERGGDVL